MSPSSDDLEIINKFLRSHRVMTMDHQYSADNGGYWTLFVTYQENGSPEAPQPMNRSNKKDYREILNEEEFDRFAKMRDLRRNLAKQEAKPAYAIFTDEELANIARLPELTGCSLRAPKGQRARSPGQSEAAPWVMITQQRFRPARAKAYIIETRGCTLLPLQVGCSK